MEYGQQIKKVFLLLFKIKTRYFCLQEIKAKSEQLPPHLKNTPGYIFIILQNEKAIAELQLTQNTNQ